MRDVREQVKGSGTMMRCAYAALLFAAAANAFTVPGSVPMTRTAAPATAASRLNLRSSTKLAGRSFAPALRQAQRNAATKVSMEFDYDVIIVGCGVGGHGAALHARGQGLKTAIFTGGDVGGTCVNRGCVPSKALLAASGRVREMKDAEHLSGFGIEVKGDVKYDREKVAAHAAQVRGEGQTHKRADERRVHMPGGSTHAATHAVQDCSQQGVPVSKAEKACRVRLCSC
jgi:hypothetical protein